MTNAEARKLFFSFLKKNGVYVKYIRRFKEELKKPVENRFNNRQETTIVNFCLNNYTIGWIVRAFTWFPEYNFWDEINCKWQEFYNDACAIENEKINSTTASVNNG